MIFYDFEVFKHDWLVVCKDTEERKTYVIVNDRDKLQRFYNKFKSEIWVGYNSRNYDQYILKAILVGFNPAVVNDFIINKGRKGWEFSSSLSQIQLYNYDCCVGFNGLKQLEGFLGNSIRETTVDFNVNHKLTESEIKEVVMYCNHDVQQTMEVFLKTVSDFNAHVSLIKEFKLNYKHISKTKPQLSALILGAEFKKSNDEFDIKIVDTIKLNKYKCVQEWYEKTRDSIVSDMDLNFKYNTDLKLKSKFYKDTKLTTNIHGVEHVFGWGGLHGAIPNYIAQGCIVNSDVGSFYPSLMIQYDFLSRSVKDKSKYKEIYDYRMMLKKEGKKKEQQPYKIVLNATYGAGKDQYNKLYDPRQANNVCINGQLMLLDLIEKVFEKIPLATLIQTNTDGVMWKLPDDSYLETYKAICDEWCHRTRMTLEHDLIQKVIQKDVNNYIVVMNDGKMKSKGAFVKDLSDIDYDLPIVNIAMKEYFINGVAPETTINSCNDLRKFQKICKVSSKYKSAWHGDTLLNEKIIRVFASNNLFDRGVFKQKADSETKEKIANTPLRCFIVNESVNDKATNEKYISKLDKSWYIELTWKRIGMFIKK